MRFLTDSISTRVIPAQMPTYELNPPRWDGYGRPQGIHWSLAKLYSRTRREGPLVSPDMALERHLQRVTAANASEHTGTVHEPMELYTMAEDCPHHLPDDLELGFGLNDMIAAEHERRHPGDSWRAEGYFKRLSETEGLFMQAQLLRLMGDLYSDTHNGVCLLDPQGSCCKGCAEGDEDSGHDPGGCYRQDRAREAMDEFWYFQGDADNRAEAA